MTPHRCFRAGSFAVTCTALIALSCSSGDERDAKAPGPSADGGPRLHNPNCRPRPGADTPDAEGDDSNCDGIDGDLLHAVFVAPAGTDAASGEPTTPVKTLSRAVALAQTSGRDVYVCSGTYADNVVIEQRGVHIYGGFDCTNGWARTEQHAVVAPSAGKPLRVAGAVDVLIRDVDFRAPDAVEPGTSSVAVTVLDSQQVRIENAVLQAGNGAPGKPGEPAGPALAILPEKAANGASAPAGLTCPFRGTFVGLPAACIAVQAGGNSLARSYSCETSPGQYAGGGGGQGGDGPSTVYVPSNGGPGGVGIPASTGPSPLVVPGRATRGRSGQRGAAGKNGTPAPSGFGSVVSGEYMPSNSGSDGTPGGVGQAGDGGNGGRAYFASGSQDYIYSGGGGGQGGFPGCGGAAGRGGGGGGASIALVGDDSKVALREVTIISGTGGVGGPASPGLPGQPGGEPGDGGLGIQGSPVDTNGAPGGKGGAGGPGGDGGPGAGGPSLGIVVVGEDPELLLITYQIGEGGSGATSIGGLASVGGVSGNVHRIK